MNEPFDPLEAELAALTPREPSQELRRRIAAELATDVPGRPGWLWLAKHATAGRLAACTIAAAALAACAIAAFTLRRSDRPTITLPADDSFQPPIAVAFDEAAPSVWAYQQALSRSPAEFEALLDKHAAQGFQQGGQAPPPGKPVPTHLFIGSDRNLLLEGEL
jgi:hypothetical protein